MNLMKKIRVFEFTTTGIRVCGMIFLLLGACGAMMQTQLLGAGNLTNSQLLTALEQNLDLMENATIALALQAAGSAALPIFVFLLVEGATHTSNFGKYFLRVLTLAIVCQVPYNLVMSGTIGTITRLNPVFAQVMGLIMLYFFRRYSDKKFSNFLIKFTAVLGVFLWSVILGIDHGPCCAILTALLWMLRGKPNLQTFAGIMTVFCCSIFSMFYLAAPIGFLILHFYEGKQGSENRLINYFAYPVILLVCGLVAAAM